MNQFPVMFVCMVCCCLQESERERQRERERERERGRGRGRERNAMRERDQHCISSCQLLLTNVIIRCCEYCNVFVCVISWPILCHCVYVPMGGTNGPRVVCRPKITRKCYHAIATTFWCCYALHNCVERIPQLFL